MATEGNRQPLLSHQNTVSHIYKLNKEQLRKLFVSDGLENQKIELQDHGSTNGILKKLATEASTGIIGDEKDLKRRKNVFGTNTKPLPQPPTFLESIKQTCRDKLWWIVTGSAVLAMICGFIANGVAGLGEGFSVIVAIFLIIVIVSFADYFKDKRFVHLQESLLDMTVPVIRGKFGATQTVSVWDLVVGDIVLLEAGCRVPADCLIIESADLQAEDPYPEDYQEGIDQPPKKLNKSAEKAPGASGDPFLPADCLLVQGQCKAVVCAVGTNSSRGEKRRKMATDVDTALQSKLKNLANRFTIYALYGALLIFLALSITLIITVCSMPKPKDGSNEPGVGALLFEKLTKQINLCVIMIVVSVPEGLPLTVGVSIAFSVKKMLKDKILIRQLEGPERMGSVNEICCGKTGTLTKGEMKVVSFNVEGRAIKNSRPNTLLNTDLQQSTIDLIQSSILYNTEARVEMDTTTYIPVGNGTEVALLKFLQDAGIPVHLLIQRKLGRIRGISPFSPERKRSVTALISPTNPEKVQVFVKGAPEVVVKESTHIIGPQGVSVFSAEERDNLLNNDGIVAKMAATPLRVLGFAYAEMDLDTWNNQYENQGTTTERTLEDAISSGNLGLTYIATFGLKDSLRDTVHSAVQHCRQDSGITIRLISGDHLQTARAVAQKAGILSEEEASQPYAYMHAEEFRATVGQLHTSYNDDGQEVITVEHEQTFQEVMENLVVLARATSADKHLIVTGLKAMGKQVAVTGEGINDVSALQKSDVGLAMGSGCSAAKEASSLVLTDDDFQASLFAIMWGRNIFHNVARFLQFQITVNISVLWTVFIGCCFFADTPISPVGLLWINLIMDTFAALALATEPPLPDVIKGRPGSGATQILSDHVWRQILGISFLNMIVMTIIIFFGSLIAGLEFSNSTPLAVDMPDHFDNSLARADQPPDAQLYLASLDKQQLFSFILNSFVFMQVANEINCRKVGPREFNVFQKFFHNFYFLAVIAGTVTAQVLVTQWIPGLFSVCPLPKGWWGGAAIIGCLPLLVGAILKLTPETWPNKVTCGHLPHEDDAVDDHPVLKAWNKAQEAAADKPSKPSAVNDEEGSQLALIDHDQEADGDANGDFKRVD